MHLEQIETLMKSVANENNKPISEPQLKIEELKAKQGKYWEREGCIPWNSQHERKDRVVELLRKIADLADACEQDFLWIENNLKRIRQSVQVYPVQSLESAIAVFAEWKKTSKDKMESNAKSLRLITKDLIEADFDAIPEVKAAQINKNIIKDISVQSEGIAAEVMGCVSDVTLALLGQRNDPRLYTNTSVIEVLEHIVRFAKTLDDVRRLNVSLVGAATILDGRPLEIAFPSRKESHPPSVNVTEILPEPIEIFLGKIKPFWHVPVKAYTSNGLQSGKKDAIFEFNTRDEASQFLAAVKSLINAANNKDTFFPIIPTRNPLQVKIDIPTIEIILGLHDIDSKIAASAPSKGAGRN